MPERWRSYNRWLKERFGQRVYKVIVDAGFTCPNRDGTVAVGGCAYCNNNSFRPPSAIKTSNAFLSSGKLGLNRPAEKVPSSLVYAANLFQRPLDPMTKGRWWELWLTNC